MLIGEISAEKITGGAWTSLNHGHGTGLDADLLDGSEASDFALADHHHYQKTIIVGPVGDGSDEFANGDALLAALDGITDASATNPYLLKIEPGRYHLDDGLGGHRGLDMKSWVDIEGAGPNLTAISSTADTFGTVLATASGTINVVNNANLRGVKAISIGVEADEYSAGIMVRDVSTIVEISNVIVESTSYDRAWALSVYQSGNRDGSVYVKISNCKVYSETAVSGYAIRNDYSMVLIDNCDLNVLSTGDFGGAVRTGGGGGTSIIRNVTGRATMTGDGQSFGLLNYGQSLETKAVVSIYNSHLIASAPERSSGIYSDSSDVYIFNSKIESFGNSSTGRGLYNIHQGTGGYKVKCIGSHIISSGPTVASYTDFDVKIANTVLEGAAVIDPDERTKCSLVQDENFDTFIDSCP